MHRRADPPAGAEAELVGADDNKGWNRASIIFNSRSAQRPLAGPASFAVPRGLGTAKTLALSLFAGAAITLLYVWAPLMIVVVMTGVDLGVWYGVVMAATPLVVCLGLFG